MKDVATTSIVICPLCKKTTVGLVFKVTEKEVEFKCLVCKKMIKLPKEGIIIS
jgi:hypothetical protein